MRTFNETVFDDFIYGTEPVHTPAQFAELLGKSDQLSIQAVVERATIRTTLTVAVEHSQDGMNWAAKNAFPEIDAESLGSGTTTLGGAEPGKYPSNGLVRLRISLGSESNPSAHVRVYITGRDKAKKFLICACPEEPSRGTGGEVLRLLEEAARIERAREATGALPAAGPRIAEEAYLAPKGILEGEGKRVLRAKLDELSMVLAQAVSPVDHRSAQARAGALLLEMLRQRAPKLGAHK